MKNLYTTKADTHVFGDNRPRAALTKIGFVRWVQMINPEIVDPSLKEKLTHYPLNVIEWIMGKVDVDAALRKAYKRSAEITDQIKELQSEKKRCDAFVKSYLVSKTYQTLLDFDVKALK